MEYNEREYETWKSNCIYLYSFLTTHETPFPYSTCFDWGNIYKQTNDIALQYYYYGTNVVEDSSYVVKGTVSIPLNNIKPSKYNEGQSGDFECTERVEDITFIQHNGDVRRIKVMHQNKSICATSSSDGHCYIIDFNQQEIVPIQRSHGGGFGLSWSPILMGTFAVCEQSNIHIYSIEKDEGLDISDVHDSINDICFNYEHQTLLSVGEDSNAIITDIRTMKKELVYYKTHENDANACSFDPNYSNIFVTGGGVDGIIKFWDTRRPSLELCHIPGASDGINSCMLSPNAKGYLISSSKDRLVRIYNMNRVGEDQTSNDADDGGSEFLFAHSGHLNEVFDSVWNPDIPFVVGTAGDGRDIQFWKPTQNLMVEDRTILKPDFLN